MYLTGPFVGNKGPFVENIVNEVPIDMQQFWKQLDTINLNTAPVREKDDFVEVDETILKKVFGSYWKQEYINIASKFGKVLSVLEIVLLDPTSRIDIALDVCRKCAKQEIIHYAPFQFWNSVKSKWKAKQKQCQNNNDQYKVKKRSKIHQSGRGLFFCVCIF